MHESFPIAQVKNNFLYLIALENVEAILKIQTRLTSRSICKAQTLLIALSVCLVSV